MGRKTKWFRERSAMEEFRKEILDKDGKVFSSGFGGTRVKRFGWHYFVECKEKMTAKKSKTKTCFCSECGWKFSTALDYNPPCPKCHSGNTWISTETDHKHKKKKN